MIVKNIDDFLHDIDQKRITHWIVEDDCHSKVKKVKMVVSWILTDREKVKTLQITLEQNSLHHARTKRMKTYSERHWVVPNRAAKAEYCIKDCETGSLPEKVKKGLSKELDEPIYDGRHQFEDGERHVL